MKTKASGVSLTLALALAGCGGSVEQSGNTGGSAGAGGAGAMAGTAGVAGSAGGGAGGVAGAGAMGGVAGAGAMGGVAGAGAMGGAGGSVACGQTQESLSVKIQPTWGTPPTCSMGAAETNLWEATGSVLKSDAGMLTLDTCPPNADCMVSTAYVYVDAPGLSFFVPTGAFVKVRYELAPAWGGCNTRISIRNVPSWGGLPNPAGGGDALYLIGVDGMIDHPDAPFAVGKLPLGCGSGGPSCGEPADDYALTFSSAPGQPAAVVGMGQSAILGKLASQPMTVHNMRSFVTGYCDDYWNWGWWATRAYVK